MTTSVNSATNNNSLASATGATNQLVDSNFSDFLQLLTTQLQNQDPTDPTDTDQLTQQIATLSEVEQQISTNNSLQQLVSLYTSSQTSNMVSYIGKDIDATGNSGSLQDGQALFAYNLPEAAATATVTISNSAGQTVFSGSGPTAAGRNQVLWDGTDNSGNQLADGNYTIAVTAADASGNPITATTYTTGIVTSVDTTNGTSALSIGNLSVPIANVESVRNVETTDTTGTSGTGTSS